MFGSVYRSLNTISVIHVTLEHVFVWSVAILVTGVSEAIGNAANESGAAMVQPRPRAFRQPSKERAPAWLSGGSSNKPRKCKPLLHKRPAARARGTQVSSKRGTKLLLTRAMKRPSHRIVPYTPAHQQALHQKRSTRGAAEQCEMKLETLLKMTDLKLLRGLWGGGFLEKFRSCPNPKCKGLTKKRGKRQPGRLGPKKTVRAAMPTLQQMVCASFWKSTVLIRNGSELSVVAKAGKRGVLCSMGSQTESCPDADRGH
jgi:hypothetical protein